MFGSWLNPWRILGFQPFALTFRDVEFQYRLLGTTEDDAGEVPSSLLRVHDFVALTVSFVWKYFSLPKIV